MTDTQMHARTKLGYISFVATRQMAAIPLRFKVYKQPLRNKVVVQIKAKDKAPAEFVLNSDEVKYLTRFLAAMSFSDID